jgi:hypothetical protein
MADQVTFSRNMHFTSLDADPNMPQAATLIREIEEDATVYAAGVTIVGDQIDMVETESDVAVSMKFRNVSGQVEWADLGSSVQTAILAVMAAHTGTPTTQLEQSVLSNSATENTDGVFTEKCSITTPPLVAGKYRIEASCEHYLSSTPGTPGVDRSQARIYIDDSAAALDNWYHNGNHWCEMVASRNVGEGETLSAAIEHRKAGGTNAKISRCRLTVRHIDGETEV